MKVKDICLLIATFAKRFKLSDNGKSALLELIRCILPKPNNLPKTFNAIKKKSIGNIKKQLKVKYYCSKCKMVLVDEELCQNCSEPGLFEKNVASFHYLDIDLQLKIFIEFYYEQIMWMKTNELPFYDLTNNNFYDSRENYINLLLYVDGINVENSAKLCFWPVILSVIDVPPKIRNSICSNIIAGVWCGEEKPNHAALFDDLAKQLSEINKNGIKVLIDDEERVFFVKVNGIVCDAQARAIALHMLQYNGYCSCPFCEIEGIFEIFKILSNVIEICL